MVTEFVVSALPPMPSTRGRMRRAALAGHARAPERAASALHACSGGGLAPAARGWLPRRSVPVGRGQLPPTRGQARDGWRTLPRLRLARSGWRLMSDCGHDRSGWSPLPRPRRRPCASRAADGSSCACGWRPARRPRPGAHGPHAAARPTTVAGSVCQQAGGGIYARESKRRDFANRPCVCGCGLSEGIKVVQICT
jgi:hypothetical protein